MNELFNTTFEVSLRILLILNESSKKISVERITSIDFIATYGKEFEISDYNLNGDNKYKFSEYSNKRKIILEAVKTLILNDYVKLTCNKQGFNYSITKEGKKLCKSMNNDYETNFSNTVKQGHLKYGKYTDRELINYINKCAVDAIGVK